MNDSQNAAGSDNSQFGPTRNPQAPGGQNLSDTATNLQTTTPDLFTGNNSVSITQVGDGSFTPFTPDNTTQTTVTAVTAKPANNHLPVILGSALLIVLVLIISWLMVRKQPSY